MEAFVDGSRLRAQGSSKILEHAVEGLARLEPRAASPEPRATNNDHHQSAEALLATRNLIDVGVQGDDVRRRMHGARTTFVRVFEVHVDAPVPSRPAGLSAGEVRIVGRPASEAAATGVVKAAGALADGAPLTGFSLADLYALAPDPDALAELCSRLHDAGLEAIADTPLDSNLLEDVPTAVRAARDAGLGVWRLTLHALPAGLSSELMPARRSS